LACVGLAALRTYTLANIMPQEIISRLIAELSPLHFEVTTAFHDALDPDCLNADDAPVKFREVFSVSLRLVNKQRPSKFLRYFIAMCDQVADYSNSQKADVESFVAFLSRYVRQFCYKPNPLYPQQTLAYKEVLVRAGNDSILINDHSFAYYMELIALKQQDYDQKVDVELQPILIAVRERLETLLITLTLQTPAPTSISPTPRKKSVAQTLDAVELYNNNSSALTDLWTALHKHGFLAASSVNVFKAMFKPGGELKQKMVWTESVSALAYFIRELSKKLGKSSAKGIYETVCLWITVQSKPDLDPAELRLTGRSFGADVKEKIDKAISNLPPLMR
jgi:hypothetical protein